MKIGYKGVSSWLCNQCGYIWAVGKETRPPQLCALCKACDWDEERTEVDGELPGA